VLFSAYEKKGVGVNHVAPLKYQCGMGLARWCEQAQAIFFSVVLPHRKSKTKPIQLEMAVSIEDVVAGKWSRPTERQIRSVAEGEGSVLG
jgi:hypothetical protein